MQTEWKKCPSTNDKELNQKNTTSYTKYILKSLPTKHVKYRKVTQY